MKVFVIIHFKKLFILSSFQNTDCHDVQHSNFMFCVGVKYSVILGKNTVNYMYLEM
jgi:hypothetical protein